MLKSYEAATIIELGSADELVLGDLGHDQDNNTQPPMEIPWGNAIDIDD